MQVCLHASNGLPHHQPRTKNYTNKHSKHGHHSVECVSETKTTAKTYATRSSWALLEVGSFCQRKAVAEQTGTVALLPATVHCEALLLTVVDVERGVSHSCLAKSLKSHCTSAWQLACRRKTGPNDQTDSITRLS